MSAPGLSWDAMFKIAKIKLIPDPETYIFFEKGTRSEISSISNRYIKVSNKYLKPYDIKQKPKHIYLHTSNKWIQMDRSKRVSIE